MAAQTGMAGLPRCIDEEGERTPKRQRADATCAEKLMETTGLERHVSRYRMHYSDATHLFCCEEGTLSVGN